MPWSYEVDTTQGIAYSVASGAITDGDLVAHQRSLTDDPDFHPNMLQLLDFRSTTEVKVTTQGVRAVIAGNPWSEGAKRALVAPKDLVYGMARMFELGRIDPKDEFCVFVRWLKRGRGWGCPPKRRRRESVLVALTPSSGLAWATPKDD
ncbi:MAG TPA: hypothetical protein VGB22_02500 [candidate division Zixibacteria bacterium]|jgi:hypothetical protein